jgi:hypothetical protein
VRQRHEPPWR